jgi:hypothetical protein
MKETVIQAVTQAILELKVANHLERLDRRISDLTDRVATLGVRPAPDNDADCSNDDDLEVYDADRNIGN